MGTSISQPSPKRADHGGKAWTELKEAFENDHQNVQIFSRLFRAINLETNNGAVEVLLDPGVKIVERKMRELSTKDVQVETAILSTLISDTRFELAVSNANSFFAELALSSAVKSSDQLKGPEVLNRFIVEYLTTLVDYFLSRDLPETFGSSFLSSPAKIKKRIESIRSSLNESLNDVSDLKIAIQKIMRTER